METNFQIKVQTEDIDNELRNYLYTKLRHIATEKAKELVDEKFDEFLSKRVEDYLNDMYKKDSWSFRSQLDDAVKIQIEKNTPDAMEIFNEMRKIIVDSIHGFDIEYLVRKVLKEEIEAVALDTIKEKVINALK